MSNDVKVKGFDNLIKRNKASIINKDVSEYEAAKLRRKKELEHEENLKVVDDLVNKTKDLENKIDGIQDNITTILELLRNRK